jgi:FAD/FMN-containing dehydrogenase
MRSVTFRTREGAETTVSGGDLSRLGNALAGDLLFSDHPEFDEARAQWNAMIDRRPAAIVRCGKASDVPHAVKFARDHDLLLAVKGAGHNIAGRGTCEGGLVIDFSRMRSVDVDPATRTARVAPGCTLGEIDAATQAHGLVVPSGINSTTGIAGLTLGGGFGWLTRRFGFTVDSLRSAEVVTAEGETLGASDEENPDLFWAIRGGGGNFGVVTSFEFNLHPVGPEVLSGLIVYPMEAAAGLLGQLRDLATSASRDLSTLAVLRKAPPLPFLPEEWHGKHVLVIAACYIGGMSEGERALEPLRSMGNPIADVIQPHSFTDWQQAFDPLLTAGARNYWKSHDFTEMKDEALDLLVDFGYRVPTDHTEILLFPLGGAAKDVAPDATAYPHRDTEFIVNVHARWEFPEDDERCIAWAGEFFHATAPFASGGVYMNFMPEDEADRNVGAYGGNLPRLRMLKRRYDPSNFFRTNQNIRPDDAA